MSIDRVGQFFVIEGGEGAGKSVCQRALQAALNPETTVFTREPGGDPVGEQMRAFVKANAGSMSAQEQYHIFLGVRWRHIFLKIRPALLAGKYVVCDRFDMSTFAYQINGEDDGQALLDLFRLERREYLRIIPAPFYLYLDVDPRIGIPRAKGRAEGPDAWDDRKIEFHNRVRAGYHKFLSEEIGPNGHIYSRSHIFDAHRTEKEVVDDVVSFVTGALA